MKRICGMGLAAALCSTTAWAQKYDGSGSPEFVPHTLQEALASAYLTNPTLQAARAQLRATDEQVPTALAGWRPVVTGNVGLSYYKGINEYNSTTPGEGGYRRKFDTPGYSAGVTITQNIYTGGKTTAATHQAVNNVMAARANLISAEQKVFKQVVSAYVGVIEREQLLQVNINNERVLQQQLRATNERFHVGEITRTDVAQAESAYATAKATRQQAEGTLQTAQATYMQIVGMAPPPNLVPPQPLVLPVKDAQTAASFAVRNNPDVINALFTEAAQKDAVSVAVAAILPKVSATAAYQKSVNQGLDHQTNDNKYATLNFNIPVYQGGSEYAGVRQAKQQLQYTHREVDTQRRAAAQDAVANWQTLVATQAAISSNRAAIRAGIIALDGVERQAIVGTSTTLEVLQQQSTLLNAQVALVQSLSSLVTASYNVAAAIGRLTALDLNLKVPLYNEKAYYEAVKDRLWGINDYALNQPGR